MNKDQSHSWVRISHGLNKLVTNLNNEQETSEVQFWRLCVKIECGWLCKPNKGQSKTTQRRYSAPYEIPVSILLRQFTALLIRWGNKGQRTAITPSSTSNLWMPHRHRDSRGKQLGHLMLLRGDSPETRVPQPSGEIRKHRRFFSQPKQLSPFSWTSETAVSQRRDPVRLWGRRFLDTRPFLPRGWKQTLTIPQNDIWSMFERPSWNIVKHQFEGRTHLLKNISSTAACLAVHPVQKRLSIYNWNPEPRRGEEGAIEKQITWKLHIITLQEASDFVDVRASHESVPRDPLWRECSVIQQGHLLPWCPWSNPFTFTTPGAYCLIKWWKEIQAPFCRACYHVPLRRQPLSFKKKNIHGPVVTHR